MNLDDTKKYVQDHDATKNPPTNIFKTNRAKAIRGHGSLAGLYWICWWQRISPSSTQPVVVIREMKMSVTDLNSAPKVQNRKLYQDRQVWLRLGRRKRQGQSTLHKHFLCWRQRALSFEKILDCCYVWLWESRLGIKWMHFRYFLIWRWKFNSSWGFQWEAMDGITMICALCSLCMF